MSAKIKTLFDKVGNKLYPKTKVQAVYNENDTPLDQVLRSFVRSTTEQGTTPVNDYAGIIDVETLPQSGVKNAIYRVTDDNSEITALTLISNMLSNVSAFESLGFTTSGGSINKTCTPPEGVIFQNDQNGTYKTITKVDLYSVSSGSAITTYSDETTNVIDFSEGSVEYNVRVPDVTRYYYGGNIEDNSYDMFAANLGTASTKDVPESGNASSTQVVMGNDTRLTNLGTASTKDVPESGNASTTQVVMGNDTRLSDSRPASTIYVNGPNANGSITASTTDLTPGSSQLASGSIYLVYE